MTLAEYIVQYRKEHDLSQRQFAQLCGLSNGYISMIENNYNPSTKKPLVPTLVALNKISSAMHITLDELFSSVDDMAVSLSSRSSSSKSDFNKYTDEELLLISSWRQASEDERIEISHILRKYGFNYSGAEYAESQVKYIRHYLTAAAAGYASPIEGEDFELLPVDSTVPPHADFCIDIDGDSMEPYIKNGQRVYVQRDVSLKEFEPGIFFVDGDVYCKQWCIDYAGTLHLLSANPKREDANISIPRDSGRNVVCYGKVLLGQKLPQPFYR